MAGLSGAALVGLSGCLGGESDEEIDTADPGSSADDQEEGNRSDTDGLGEPPEQLDPEYVRKHLEIVDGFDGYSIRIRSSVDGIYGEHLEGDIHVSQVENVVYADLAVASFGVEWDDPDIGVAVYSDGSAVYERFDAGDPQYTALDCAPDDEGELISCDVVNHDHLRQLTAPSLFQVPIVDLETLIDEANPIFEETRSADFEAADDVRAHHYMMESRESLEGTLREELADVEDIGIRMAINAETGAIAGFVVEYQRPEDDAPDELECPCSNRFEAVLYDVDADRELTPEWLEDAQAATE